MSRAREPVARPGGGGGGGTSPAPAGMKNRGRDKNTFVGSVDEHRPV